MSNIALNLTFYLELVEWVTLSFMQGQWDENKLSLVCYGRLSHVMTELQALCSALKWVVWTSSSNTRGPSCFSNSSWGNSLRHLNHETTLPYQLAGSQGKFSADWSVRNSTEFSLAVWGAIWQSMQIVSMWQLKSLSAEQPWHWKADREQRERGGRKKGGSDNSMLF